MDRLNIQFGSGLLPAPLLTLVVGLKLTRAISTGPGGGFWWWVLAPAWIPVAVGLPVLAVIILVFRRRW